MLIKALENYRPFNEQEEQDLKIIKKAIKEIPDIFHRHHLTAHMTASSWLVNQAYNKVLMIHHNIYNSWSWLGGHADGEEDLLQVAIKEAQEESGLKHIHPVSEDIFSVEVLTVDGHEKHNHYVPSHLHLNITYLLQADENQDLFINEHENSGVAWFTLEEAVKASTEPWFQKRIYSKLNEKLSKKR
ncbi:MAG: NUDIX hydrolase [Clostridia bacterium]|nr:NUDIX hydrolase [Clostridia bacterium]